MATDGTSNMAVAEEEGGHLLADGYHVERVDETFAPRLDWKLPREIS